MLVASIARTRRRLIARRPHPDIDELFRLYECARAICGDADDACDHDEPCLHVASPPLAPLLPH